MYTIHIMNNPTDNNKLSIVIPSRNEQFLYKTIHDLLQKAEGEIEILPVLDGYYPPAEEIIIDPRVIYIHKGEAEGMRPGINDAVSVSTGKYIMKIDAHCMVDKGFDVKLKAVSQPNWVLIPRRKRLDPINWCIQDVGKVDIDYEFLSFPDNPSDFGGPGLNGRVWDQRIKERLNDPKYDIDDNMSFQGSCWFMEKDYFYQLELMDWKNYGTFWNEAQEIGLKSWLSGGAVKTVKTTWYAHLHKGKTFGRGYRISSRTIEQGAKFGNEWINNKAWAKQTLPFSWLIDHFQPVPGWEGDWRKKFTDIGITPDLLKNG